MDEPNDFAAFIAATRNVFVVIDYAETRSDLVADLVRAAVRHRQGGYIRFLLLARDGGDWWKFLHEKARGDKTVEALLVSPSSKQGPHPMAEAAVNPEDRVPIFTEALSAFAKFQEVSCQKIAPPDLSADRFRQPLYLHLAALSALRSEKPAADEDNLVAATLGHERRYWRQLLVASDLDEETMLSAFEQALTLITLAGGCRTARDSRDLINRTPRMRGATPAEQDLVFDLLRRLYPWEGGVRGLEPDVLGEQLVAENLRRDDEPIDNLLGKGGRAEQARHALTVLTRLARRIPEQSNLLHQALMRHLGTREREALSVAKETGAPMPELMAAVIQVAKAPMRKHVVNALRPEIPKDTENLATLAIEIGRQRVVFVEHKSGKGQKAARQRSTAFEFLGEHLRQAGQYAEAVEAFRQALACTAAWVSSLVPADRAALARSHGNFGIALARTGAFSEAIEQSEKTEAIWRDLAARQPDAYRAEWAMSLSNLGSHLRALGRFEDALEKAEAAEAIWRDLAARQPDAYCADWAGSLANVAEARNNAGRSQNALAAAEQAVSLLRVRAANDTDRSLLGFAQRVLAESILGVGDAALALAEAERARETWGEIFRERPNYASEQFGKILAVHVHCLRATGDVEAAVSRLNQAISTLMPHFRKRPSVLVSVMKRLIEEADKVGGETAMHVASPELRAEVLAVGDRNR